MRPPASESWDLRRFGWQTTASSRPRSTLGSSPPQAMHCCRYWSCFSSRRRLSPAHRPATPSNPHAGKRPPGCVAKCNPSRRCFPTSLCVARPAARPAELTSDSRGAAAAPASPVINRRAAKVRRWTSFSVTLTELTEVPSGKLLLCTQVVEPIPEPPICEWSTGSNSRSRAQLTNGSSAAPLQFDSWPSFSHEMWLVAHTV